MGVPGDEVAETLGATLLSLKSSVASRELRKFYGREMSRLDLCFRRRVLIAGHKVIWAQVTQSTGT